MKKVRNHAPNRRDPLPGSAPGSAAKLSSDEVVARRCQNTGPQETH